MKTCQEYCTLLPENNFLLKASKKKKLLTVLSQLQNFSKKTITLPVSADSSTNNGNLVVVFWNIILE